MSKPTPRYATVANALAADIAEGRRAVGSMLPPEDILSENFGVSRATIREALRRLRDLGLVTAARGVGTRITAIRPRGNYVLAARSVADIMGYADRTTLEITRRHTIRATPALATRLGCDPGSQFRHVTGIRRIDPGQTAISCVDLYITAEFSAVADSPDLVLTPAYRLITQTCGIPVAEIRQDITAVALTQAQAKILGSPPNSPGLHIRRRFYAEDGRLLEATLNVHAAADRFAYSLRLG